MRDRETEGKRERVMSKKEECCNIMEKEGERDGTDPLKRSRAQPLPWSISLDDLRWRGRRVLLKRWVMPPGTPVGRWGDG